MPCGFFGLPPQLLPCYFLRLGFYPAQVQAPSIPPKFETRAAPRAIGQPWLHREAPLMTGQGKSSTCPCSRVSLSDRCFVLRPASYPPYYIFAKLTDCSTLEPDLV